MISVLLIFVLGFSAAPRKSYRIEIVEYDDGVVQTPPFEFSVEPSNSSEVIEPAATIQNLIDAGFNLDTTDLDELIVPSPIPSDTNQNSTDILDISVSSGNATSSFLSHRDQDDAVDEAMFDMIDTADLGVEEPKTREVQS
jgi:hypothetical protein